MSLVLYNTLTRKKEAFEPLEPNKVKIYCCGVTVYDYSHLGHARCYITWDTVRRYLIWRGYDVHYVQNFTDIDDKILNRARDEDSTMRTVAEEYTAAYLEDMARLNVLRADEYTYATQTLDGIKRLISELEQKGYAYRAGGDVYYAVRKFDGYGKLSGRKLEDMLAGASGRVSDDASVKRGPFDFALWKGVKEDDKNFKEDIWKSPWGRGRPGWHIECSAMIRDRLGDSIDIHMGGSDLIFPHHENEIAQSEAATGHPLARYWLHNGMVNVDGEKMSKSLGNFTTIRKLIGKPDQLMCEGDPIVPMSPMALRLFCLQASYRKPIDFTEGAIVTTQGSWVTLKGALLFGLKQGEKLGWADVADPDFLNPAAMRIDRDSVPVQKFQTAMDEDFNTAEALAVLFDLAKKLERANNLINHAGKADIPSDTLRQQWQTLVCLAEVLGLKAAPDASSSVLSDKDAKALIEKRKAARAAKDFAESDRIRDELKANKIRLIDKPDGTTEWYRDS